jgi:phospholipase C
MKKLCLISSIAVSLLLAGCGSGKSSQGGGGGSQYQLTVAAPATNSGTVSSTPAGITCPGHCTASFASNTQVTLTATASTGYSFGGWSGGGCSGTSTCVVTLNSNMTVTPTFNSVATSYTLTVTAPAANTGAVASTPAGINCSGSIGGNGFGQCSASFNAGTQVTLTATAMTGYAFGGWSGGGCSGTSNCVVTLNSAVTVTPTFVAATSYALTVTPTPANSGVVISNPTGINCPVSGCTANFVSGTAVILTETPNTNYSFVGWSGGGCAGTSTTCTVNVTAATNVTATFQSTATSYALTVNVQGSGTVTSNPAGINCSTSTCSATFPANTPITLTETAGANYTFLDWGGACSGTGACTVTLTAAGSVAANFTPNTPSLQSINHILIFAQENRSLDHYFGYMRQYWANNGIPDQTFDGLPQFNPQTGTIPPAYGPPPTVPGCDPTLGSSTDCQASSTAPVVTSFHAQSVCTEAMSPFWNEAHIDWDYNNPIGTGPFQSNGWVQAAANDARQVIPQLNDVNGYRGMEYFTYSELNYYYFMASNFATSDRWFAPIMSRTQLNRMFLLAGTTGGHVYPLAPPYNALSNTTIFEALQNAGITWKIYVDSTDTGCTDSDSGCLIKSSYINMFTYYKTINGNPALLANIASITQLKTDMANNSLPQVALIEPPSNAGLDEHPTDTDTAGPVNIQHGAQFSESLMNALMTSPSWKDSAMIFTYDEPGGFYDHVSPQPATPPDPPTSSTYLPIDLKMYDICDGTGQLGTGTCNFAYTGYRVPLIVVSPYSKKNYVSHKVYDHTAILKLIETRFNIPPLTARDAAQADMSTDFFDFTNMPWSTPPTPPTQFTGAACNLNAPIP